MLRNYFKIAVRNLQRHKAFAAINVLGLGVGILGCLLTALFVLDEKKYGKSVEDGERIYRLYNQHTDATGTNKIAVVPPAYATYLKSTYPEVESVSKMIMTSDKFLLEQGAQRGYETGGVFVDSNFLDLFAIKLKQGRAAAALSDKSSIIINEDLARRYFGSDDPIGKTLLLNKSTVTVTGVLGALPSHFHLHFNYVMPISALGISPKRMERWGWQQFYTYAKLKPGANAYALEKKFQAYVKKKIDPVENTDGATTTPYLQPLHKVYLQSADFVYDHAKRGNETYVNALSVIALFVLLIACFNFVNLATARSLRRAKEIGVRKVVGAEKQQLVWQFLSEAIFLAFIAVAVATIAALLLVPALNDFAGKQLEFNPFLNPVLFLALLGSGVFIGVLAGIYPALVLSGFKPILVLQNLKNMQGQRSWLRPALVVLQFSISVFLIVSTLVVYRQTQYLNNADLGFSKEQVIYFEAREGAVKQVAAFKNELAQLPGVKSVTSGYGMPGDAFAGDAISVVTEEGEKEFSTNMLITDEGYIKTLGLKLIAGRDFSKSFPSDVSSAFIINETAVTNFGFKTAKGALGKKLAWNEWEPADTNNRIKRGTVVGVVKDFHLKSLHEKVAPTVIHLYPQVTETVAVNVKEAGLQNTLGALGSVWKKFAPGYPFDPKFTDESFGTMYQSEQKLSSLLWVFAVLAIVVGCLGLFGLAAFTAEQRTKEIGIRKVLGANVGGIIMLLSRNFLVLVLLSAGIAFPTAWWAMSKYLQNFPYRLDISWWVFGLALLAALLIAFITVSFQSIKAARTNPVISLRTQ